MSGKYVNSPIEADHGRLKSRLQLMRGLTQLRCARVISAGHVFIQNIRRGHYELGVEEPTTLRVRTAFTERSDQPGSMISPRLRATQQPQLTKSYTELRYFCRSTLNSP
jgi:hypothetical protein